MIFADSSALVKAIWIEPGTAVVAPLVGPGHPTMMSPTTYIELRSALAASLRSGRLPRSDGPRLRTILENIVRDAARIPVSAQLFAHAADLAEEPGLRALDSIQLASLLLLSPETTQFLCFDKHLRRAAAAHGYALIPETLDA